VTRWVNTTQRVTGKKCISYWLPANKNGTMAIMKHLGEDCRHDTQADVSKIMWVVVRNPFSRIYSCWYNKVKIKSTFLPDLRSVFKPGDPFDVFVDWIAKQPDDRTTDNHWISQTANMRLANFKPNRILRFETLHDDWNLLADIVGLDKPLKPHNCTRTNLLDHSEHVDSYTESLRTKVLCRYQMDFEQFGYPDSP